MPYFVIIQLEVGIVQMGKENKMRKEYMDREALEFELNHRLQILMGTYGEYDHYTSGFDECVSRVENFPSAIDVEKVVRCKYCRHYHPVTLDEETRELGNWGICDQAWFNSDEYDVLETDYCSHGEAIQWAQTNTKSV